MASVSVPKYLLFISVENKKNWHKTGIKQEFFKLIWESRLEKFELKFLIHNSKPHPKKRPTKDKRSFMLKTMEDMHVLELKRLGEKKEKREEEEKAKEDKTKEVKKESMENKRTDF